MRKYRWNLIWKAALINILALAVYVSAGLWVREKANIEIQSYFDERREQVQNQIISVLVDSGTPNKEKYVDKILLDRKSVV